jgi:hypothetical protein
MEHFEPIKPQKVKAYVLAEPTIRELQEKADGKERYDRQEILTHEVKRKEEFSDEQKRIQAADRWYSVRTCDLCVRESNLNEMVSKTMYARVLSGEKDGIVNNVMNDILDSKIYVTIRTEDAHGCKHEDIEILYGDGDKAKFELSYDMESMDKELAEVKHQGFNAKPDEYVYLEEVSAQFYPYAFNKISDHIMKLIKRLLRDEFTYCFKSGKLIVPDEYINKGKQGIDEWRELKGSNNKSNNMEKRLLKQAFHDKKEHAYKSMAYIMNEISTGRVDWTLPFLHVDGRWNRSRMDKLITQVANTKDKNRFLETPDEDINKKFKEYWKTILMNACNAIDELDVEEKISRESR